MSNPQADRVRDIAKLRTRAGRKRGQFLVEGPQAVREALHAHLRRPVLDAVYVTEEAFDRHPDIAELLEEVHGTPTPEQGRRVFYACGDGRGATSDGRCSHSSRHYCGVV